MIAAVYARTSNEQVGVNDEEKSVTRQIDGRVFGYDNREILGAGGQRQHVKRVINLSEARGGSPEGNR